MEERNSAFDVEAGITSTMARLAKRQYRKLISPIRARARELGYAVAVHGSLARDIDLVAVAWTEQAVSAEELLEGIVEVARTETGYAQLSADLTGEIMSERPHGRLAWAILIAGGSYIDLSVIGPHAISEYAMEE